MTGETHMSVMWKERGAGGGLVMQLAWANSAGPARGRAQEKGARAEAGLQRWWADAMG